MAAASCVYTRASRQIDRSSTAGLQQKHIYRAQMMAQEQPVAINKGMATDAHVAMSSRGGGRWAAAAQLWRRHARLEVH